jgi:hypothetical protein
MLNPFAKLVLDQLSFTIGDPHFYGFDGESFDFMGEPDRYYNLLTDTEVQVNAYFIYWATSGADNYTVADRIGIRVSDHRIRISPAGLTIDGYEVPESQRSYHIAKGRIASVERFDRLDDRVPEPMRAREGFGDFMRGYQVLTRCGYEFVVTVSTDHVNPPYLNLLSRTTRRRWPHGIIGQTSDHDGVPRQPRGQNGEGIIEGTYRDYEVSSLWGSDFKFNKYKAGGNRRRMFELAQDRFSLVISAASRKAADLCRAWALPT